ncbi:uncharacterized protein LOC111322822 [Stylophora pistillata]|nr:uncharacterized protein LOC111322822 [Stylophora pistillata]
MDLIGELQLQKLQNKKPEKFRHRRDLEPRLPDTRFGTTRNPEQNRVQVGRGRIEQNYRKPGQVVLSRRTQYPSGFLKLREPLSREWGQYFRHEQTRFDEEEMRTKMSLSLDNHRFFI